MRQERGPWYLLTGILLGVVGGLFYAWIISPAEYRNTSPASLRADFKDHFRALTAAAYMANGNLPRAQTRLALLGEEDVARTLAELAQRTLADGRDPEQARALGLLTVALGQEPGPSDAPSLAVPSPTITLEIPTATVQLPTQTSTPQPSGTPGQVTETTTPQGTVSPSLTPAPTRTLLPTGTPLPTRTPTATPVAPFALRARSFVCDPNVRGPLIQVITEDAAGLPVPGVEVIVTWDSSEDRFFTGLKPELGLGYADFAMAPGVSYSLRLSGSGQPIPGFTAAECESQSGGRYWGAWLLVFAQP